MGTTVGSYDAFWQTFATTVGSLYTVDLQYQIGEHVYPSDFIVSVSTVPEPSTWAMMLLGFAGLGFVGYQASRKRVACAA